MTTAKRKTAAPRKMTRRAAIGFRWRRYKKAYVAGSGGAVLAGIAALNSTEVITTYPWVSAGVAAVTAVGVYQVKNEFPATVDQQYTPATPSPETPPPAGDVG